MRLAAIALALILAIPSTWNSALAQGTPPSQAAPPGHGQPKAGDVPQEPEQTPAEKRQKELDQALDKKLKSICRGC